MNIVLSLAGVVWVLIGGAVLIGSKSAIHEILAFLAISFGMMFWGFAALLEQLQSIARSSAKLAQPPVRAPEPAAIESAIAEVRSRF